MPGALLTGVRQLDGKTLGFNSGWSRPDYHDRTLERVWNQSSRGCEGQRRQRVDIVRAGAIYSVDRSTHRNTSMMSAQLLWCRVAQ